MFPGLTDVENPAVAAAKAQQEEVEGILVSCVFPAIALRPAMAALAWEVWDVVSLMPYTQRFRRGASCDD